MNISKCMDNYQKYAADKAAASVYRIAKDNIHSAIKSALDYTLKQDEQRLLQAWDALNKVLNDLWKEAHSSMLKDEELLLEELKK